MNWKRLAKSLLYPHRAIIFTLVPISVAMLVISFVFMDSSSGVSIISYVISAYTLTVCSLRVPRILNWIKKFKNENKLYLKWQSDPRLRINVSLFTSLIWNLAYATLQLCMGIEHRTFWFYSLSVYYTLLALLRFFLVWHTVSHKTVDNIASELKKYRTCGWILLLMNLILSVLVFFMIYWGRSFEHDEITTIALAAYTFLSFALAIVNTVRYKKYNSPVYSAARAISLVASCVSIITLESTMLTTFGQGTVDGVTKTVLLALTGAAVSVFIITVSVYMIISSTKKLSLKKEK